MALPTSQNQREHFLLVKGYSYQLDQQLLPMGQTRHTIKREVLLDGLETLI